MSTPTHCTAALLGLCLALTGTWHVAQAQPVYKIVGPDGKVTFSDRPLSADAAPAKNAPNAAGAAAAEAPTPALPASLQQVVRKYPVTLYTANECAPCDQGRNLLTQRGVPFNEKTVNTNADAVAFQKIDPQGRLPLLMVGAQPVAGFAAAEWNGYLDAAGYPKTSVLPANHRNPPPQALVPPKPADPNAPAVQPDAAVNTPSNTPNARKPRATPKRPVDDANPAGIKF